MTLPVQLSLPLDLPSPPATEPPPAATAEPLPAPVADSMRRATAIPTPCPPSLPAGARWRAVRTSAQPIGFVLQRSKRQTIGLVVHDDGLQLTAPKMVTTPQPPYPNHPNEPRIHPKN